MKVYIVRWIRSAPGDHICTSICKVFDSREKADTLLKELESVKLPIYEKYEIREYEVS